MQNIWILTEEYPKNVTVEVILKRVAADYGFPMALNDLKVVPIFKNGRFTFTYTVTGVSSDGFGGVYLKLVSGSSSFVDFLVFVQEREPVQSDLPRYAIEETKTTDAESRNTGVYQRLSKFVYVEFFYPGITKIMLYSLLVAENPRPTKTNMFGMRLLKTMGVEVIGKTYETTIEPFTGVSEIIAVKNAMRQPPQGNVAIRVEEHPNRITISGRLFKDGGLGHDPNVGALTAIAFCLRQFEKEKDIVITEHGLEQVHVTANNGKFMQIATRLRITLEGLIMPETVPHVGYWHYEGAQEKTATILLHVLLVAYTSAEILYANHGGTERSYFLHKTKGAIAIEKYQAGMREAYKLGDKSMIIYIPDLIIYDPEREEVINTEGKKYMTRKVGIRELKNYDYIEENIIVPSHSPKRIIRTVVLFGSRESRIEEPEVSFLLNDDGDVIIQDDAPEIFKKALIRALAS